METRNILLLVILAMIQVLMYFYICVLNLAMIQDQALVASKHYLVETEDKVEDGLGTFIFL